MHRTLRVLAASVVLATTFAACQPTGSTRCDAYWPPLAVMETQTAYRMDCTPGFPNKTPTGQNILGWADHGTKTLWIWPDGISDRLLHKVMWHEVGHAKGHHSEHHADAYAYCHMSAAEREGISFMYPWPSPADCRRLG